MHRFFRARFETSKFIQCMKENEFQSNSHSRLRKYVAGAVSGVEIPQNQILLRTSNFRKVLESPQRGCFVTGERELFVRVVTWLHRSIDVDIFSLGILLRRRYIAARKY